VADLYVAVAHSDCRCLASRLKYVALESYTATVHFGDPGAHRGRNGGAFGPLRERPRPRGQLMRALYTAD
jgi:hypothetical protein